MSEFTVRVCLVVDAKTMTETMGVRCSACGIVYVGTHEALDRVRSVHRCPNTRDVVYPGTSSRKGGCE